MFSPKIIILISGKRKSGKDYISEKLRHTIGDEKCAIVRISEPIKGHYAYEKNLNLEQLMSDNPYKETYRMEMIIWSDKIRRVDPGRFCQAACDKAPHKEMWIVSDIRRKTDIRWFKEKYGNVVSTVRINADEDVRVQRGWAFTAGVDDVASECDLDDYCPWDLIVSNNNEGQTKTAVEQVLSLARS